MPSRFERSFKRLTNSTFQTVSNPAIPAFKRPHQLALLLRNIGGARWGRAAMTGGSR